MVENWIGEWRHEIDIALMLTLCAGSSLMKGSVGKEDATGTYRVVKF